MDRGKEGVEVCRLLFNLLMGSEEPRRRARKEARRRYPLCAQISRPHTLPRNNKIVGLESKSFSVSFRVRTTGNGNKKYVGEREMLRFLAM